MAKMDKKARINNLLIIFFILLTLTSCKSDRLDIDIDDIAVKTEIIRFDKEIFETPDESLNQLFLRDTFFFNMYVDQILGYAPFIHNDTDRFRAIRDFRSAAVIRKLYGEVQKQYDNIADVEAALNLALQHYRFYFPKNTIPSFTTLINEVGAKIMPFPNTIALSLDHFLGDTFPGYRAIPELNQYQIRRMRREYLVTAWMHGLFTFSFDQRRLKGRRFIDMMVEEGKKYYFLKAMQPGLSDTIILEYTNKQLDFCTHNQAEMWNYFAENKLFYNSNESDYSRYLKDGPFTSAPNVPVNAAPRLGIYCGYMIVKSYMDSHPDVSLSELIYNMDAEKIMRESGYRP